MPVTDDTEDEPDETVVVTLSSASGADIVTASGTGTITDNDTPSFSIDSPSVVEGDSGSKNMTFTVTLSPASYQATTVDYATTATGTATAGTDYTAISSTTLSFAIGDTSKTFTVSVTGDTTDDGTSETVVVALSNATGNAEVGTANGTGTITDNDPKFSIADASATEGDSGSVNMTFTVTLGASTTQTTVSYATSNGTAMSGSDYTAKTGTLTFASGETSKTFTVSVTGDTTDEGASETFTVALSNATGGAGIDDGTATGTIMDNDPKFSIGNASVAEGDSSTANLTFTVTLSASSTSALTVNYATSNGTATAGSDYTAKTGTLTFAASTTSQTFTVSVTGDTLDEADETLTVTLSSPSSGTGIATLTGTGTILDDDPKFSINSPTVTESDSGSVNLDFEVTLSASSTSQLTVAYAQTGGTATSGTDYTAVAAGTLTFPSGTTSRTIRVSVTGDMLNEANETVIITLSNATGGMPALTTATATGTITDNDTPTFSIDDREAWRRATAAQTNLDVHGDAEFGRARRR